MKTAFKFMIAATAAIAVFSSCQKELVGETVSNTTDGVRVISVQFDNSTKATLSGVTPTFTNNDKIRVSNSTKSEECPVTVGGTTTTFTTTLSGALTAIYPADAAVLASDAADAPIASSNNFKVLATQDGTVEKAIIASATVAEGGNTATFNGLTALFEITPPSGATSITITSLNKINATTGRRSTTANAAVINTTGADDAAKRVITVTVPSDADGKAYVSLVPGVNLTDLSFDAGEAIGLKGIPTSKLGTTYTDATAANTKYTIDNQNWHPYVTISGKKWATMNIGATNESENGVYFMWGEVSGHKPNGMTFDFSGFDHSDPRYPDESQWDPTSGFCWNNVPYTNKVCEWPDGDMKVFTKYVSTSRCDLWNGIGDADNKTILDLCDDAAYVNWGGSWRTPNKIEFLSLYNETWEGRDISRLKFGTYGHYITLPVNGAGYQSSFVYNSGNYWTSDLDTSDPVCVFYFSFENSYPVGCESAARYYGMAVRPISD